MPRTPTSAVLAVTDFKAIERLAKARYALHKADQPNLEENSGSDVVAECIRRYLVQHLDIWKLDSDDCRKAIHLTAAVWPTLPYIREFDEPKIPVAAFEMLRKFHQRIDGPSMLPELLRMTRQRIGTAVDFKVEDLTHHDWASETCKLLVENAATWGLIP